MKLNNQETGLMPAINAKIKFLSQQTVVVMVRQA